MPVPYHCKLHVPPTSYSLLAAHQDPGKKILTLNEKCLNLLMFGEKLRRMDHQQKNDETKRA